MHIICTVIMHGAKGDFWHLGEAMPPLYLPMLTCIVLKLARFAALLLLLVCVS